MIARARARALGRVDHVRDQRSVAHAECGFDRLAHPRSGIRLDHEPIHDDLDIVRLVPVELHLGFDLADLPVNPHALEALPPDLFKQLAIVPFTAANNRRKDHQSGAFGEAE